ncbi:uncharacterized protein METZ01_LOCUS440393, partial [marine metagenome]
MKNLILILSVLLTSCSTLGFGDFSDQKTEVNTDRSTKIDESSSGKIPVKFTYQPLIGGRHEVFLVGDFNNWSQTEITMKEAN